MINIKYLYKSYQEIFIPLLKFTRKGIKNNHFIHEKITHENIISKFIKIDQKLWDVPYRHRCQWSQQRMFNDFKSMTSSLSILIAIMMDYYKRKMVNHWLNWIINEFFHVIQQFRSDNNELYNRMSKIAQCLYLE